MTEQLRFDRGAEVPVGLESEDSLIRERHERRREALREQPNNPFFDRTKSTRGRTFTSEIFSAAEVAALLDGCNDQPSGFRLRTLIALLYRTGMETSEALALQLSDVDLEAGRESVVVPTARLVSRTLALDPETSEILRQWLAVRAAMPGEFFFCVLKGADKGRAWSQGDVNAQCRALGQRTLGKRLNPRALRLTLVAELIAEQWPLPYIQTQLGLTDVHSFKKILPRLGIGPADQEDVAEVTRMRPSWLSAEDLEPRRIAWNGRRPQS